MDLLITAHASKASYRELSTVFGPPDYKRVGALGLAIEHVAEPETLSLSEESIFHKWIVSKLSHASGNARPHGVTAHAAAGSIAVLGTEAHNKLGGELQGRGVPPRDRSRYAAIMVNAVRSGSGAEAIASGQAR
jgi:hypothetical protein